MPIASQSFTVEGSSHFPVDMLRYDSCWPSSGTDVSSIGFSLDRLDRRYVRGVRQVRLQRHVAMSNNAAPDPTHGRWESFGWKVIRVETRKGF